MLERVCVNSSNDDIQVVVVVVMTTIDTSKAANAELVWYMANADDVVGWCWLLLLLLAAVSVSVVSNNLLNMRLSIINIIFIFFKNI